jgi:PST family polysaccharide transporter
MNDREVRKWWRSSLLHDITLLYCVQCARYLLPLVQVPFLARVLKPTGWGVMAFAQSFSAYLMLVVEYGFNLSATREVARAIHEWERISEVLAGVMGAKCILAAVCILLTVVAQFSVPLFSNDPALLWSATFAALAQSFSLLWLFQGLNRMKVVAVLDICTKVAVTIGVFLLIRTPSDAWKVLLIQGVGAWLAVIAGLVLAYRIIVPIWPTTMSIFKSLRMGWTMFLFRSSVSLYTAGNSFLLGLFAPPQFVGLFSGAEKISRAFLGLFEPINQSLFPRLSYLAQHSPSRAQQLARLGVIALGGVGMFLTVGVMALAPLLVHVLLGPSFTPAVASLRILAALMLLVGLSNAFGIQWMLPLGMDRVFNTIIVSGGALNMLLVVVLAPRYSHIGTAWAVVITEAFITVSMYLWLHHKGFDPLLRVQGTLESS